MQEGSKCLGKSIDTVNRKLCLELWETGGLAYLLESPRRDSMRKKKNHVEDDCAKVA